MKDIAKIDKKIDELLKKKEKLQKKESESLDKTIIKMIGDDFSPELVLGMLATSWKSKDEKTMEEWRKAGEKLRLPSSSKDSSKSPKDE